MGSFLQLTTRVSLLTIIHNTIATVYFLAFGYIRDDEQLYAESFAEIAQSRIDTPIANMRVYFLNQAFTY